MSSRRSPMSRTTTLAALPAPVTKERDGETLGAILAELRGLRADLHLLAAGRRADLAAPDRAALARLLPEIARAIGSRFVWTARELMVHALAADPALLAAIGDAAGPLGAGTAQRIGRLLRRGNGAAVDALRVERVGDARDGALWMLRQQIPQSPPS